MSSIIDPVIPKGATVLVTGAAGWVGSNVADQFLAHGYRVRGTARDAAKAAFIVEIFDAKYGKGQFELYSVPDMTTDGAYDHVIDGVSVVAHTASIMIPNSNPNHVIPVVVDGSTNALKAAYAQPSVQRFVLTSSSTSAVVQRFGRPGKIITVDSWTDDIVKSAWAPPPYDPERASDVYSASKNEAEKAVWKYHKENRHKRPDLVVNAVLPNVNFGKSLDSKKQGHPSSSSLPVALFGGENTYHKSLAPMNFVNVADTGRLHVAAAIHPNVKDERIFAFAGSFSWDLILGIFRKNFPNHNFVDNFAGGEDPNEIVPRARAEELLRDLGRPGWVSLEETIIQNVEDIGNKE